MACRGYCSHCPMHFSLLTYMWQLYKLEFKKIWLWSLFKFAYFNTLTKNYSEQLIDCLQIVLTCQGNQDQPQQIHRAGYYISYGYNYLQLWGHLVFCSISSWLHAVNIKYIFFLWKIFSLNQDPSKTTIQCPSSEMIKIPTVSFPRWSLSDVQRLDRRFHRAAGFSHDPL